MEGFEAHTLCFKTVVTSPLRLPPLKGSTLRSAFVGALRANFCHSPHLKHCRLCPSHTDCPTCYLAATLDPDSHRGVDVPRPFIVRPPLDSRTYYSVGDALDFEIIVFGRALALLPYVVVGVQRMGQDGVGSKASTEGRRPARGTFRVHEIWALNPLAGVSQRIHQAADGLVKVPSTPVTHRQVLERAEQMLANVGAGRIGGVGVGAADVGTLSEAPLHTVTLRLRSPLRLVDGGHLVRQLTFATLVLRLIERLEALSNEYGQHCLALDVPSLLARAREVSVERDDTRWLDVERYSSRQGRRLPMGGLVGEITFRGSLADFIPWLIWGSIVGVGKYATLGCGWYELG